MGRVLGETPKPVHNKIRKSFSESALQHSAPVQNERMDTNELKAIVTRHFLHAPDGHGKFFHGDWMLPKTKDSLQYLVDEFNAELEKAEDQAEVLQNENDDLEERVRDLESKRDERESELESTIDELKAQINELEKEAAEA